jgi:hypothetical protein
VALESIFYALETIFVARRNIFSFTGETKMATVLAGFLSPWLLGWIAATPSGQIYLLFFFPPEKSLERVVAAGVYSQEVGGGRRWWRHLGGYGWLIS